MKRFLRTVVMLVVGVAIGYWVATHRSAHAPAAASASKPNRAAVPHDQPEQAAAPSGELWLGDFESDDELAKDWKLRDALAERSEEHATHGRSAAKVIFQKGESPAFRMEEALTNNRQWGDWRGYKTLSFDLYNAQSSQQRVILQLKDQNGRAYKEDIFINGKSSQHISVRLEDLKSYVNLSRIAQFDLFRWKPGKPSTFFVDAVHLEAAARASRAEGVPSAAKATAAKPATAEESTVTLAQDWQVGWTSGLVKLQRNPAKFQGHLSNPMQMSLARGEYESAQLVLFGGAQPAHVRVSVGPLTRDDGSASFPSDVIEVRRVGYVQTNQPYYPVDYVGDWPDPLPLADDVEVPAGNVQPVWITIGAPPSLPSGSYHGTVTVSDAGGRVKSVALEVTVWDFTLPTTPHLKTAFDFYRSRLQKAYEEFVPGGMEWHGRIRELERLYFLDMLKHRVSPVMSADPLKDGFWHDLPLYLRAGLGAFGVGWRGGSNGNNWPKNSGELQQTMQWYRKAAHALRSQGLLDRAYVYTYDEPKAGDPRVSHVMQFVHWADPQLKNLLVMHSAPDPLRHAEWLKDVDILCIRIASYDPEQAKQFKQLGKEMWLYVSSPAHPFPALVIDYPAMAHRILPWMAWKYGASGLLYWCVDFWKGNPWEDPANFTKDQNGNGSLYYPAASGPVPSIRMEVLRDGMEDYEYLYRLQELIQATEARGGADPALVAQAKRLVAVDPELIDSLRSYSKDPDLLLANRRAIAEMIETLQALEREPSREGGT